MGWMWELLGHWQCFWPEGGYTCVPFRVFCEAIDLCASDSVKGWKITAAYNELSRNLGLRNRSIYQLQVSWFITFIIYLWVCHLSLTEIHLASFPQSLASARQGGSQVTSCNLALSLFKLPFCQNTLLLFWAYPVPPIRLGASKMSPFMMSSHTRLPSLNFCSLCVVDCLQRWWLTGAPMPVWYAVPPTKSYSLFTSP